MTADPPRAQQILNNRFKLVEMRGKGGFGTVWLAEDAVLRRAVAVKELTSADGVPDYEQRRKLAMREARALARVRHPAIVGVYDVIDHHDVPWIVMEYVNGTALSEILRDRAPLKEREIVGYLLPVVQGLAAAHRAGVVHRDVKPHNIVAGDDGAVSLVDFGIALVDGSTSTSGALRGTPEYIAPERFFGERAGPPADMWSVGVTLYYAREGRLPFASPDEIKYGDPLPPFGGGALNRLILDLLRKAPGERPTAVDAARILTEVLREPVPRGPVKPGPPRSREAATVTSPPPVKLSPRPRKPNSSPRAIDADRAVIRGLGTDAGAAMLVAMTAQRAAEILHACTAAERGRLLRGIVAVSPRVAGGILEAFRPNDVAWTLKHLEPEVAASVLSAMPAEVAVRSLEQLIPLDVTAAAPALTLMPVYDAVALLRAMRGEPASRVFADIARNWPAARDAMKRADPGLTERLRRRLASPPAG